MSLDWHRLRAWNGSQRHAFEELCCQIAARTPAPLDSSFTRIGAPDAGVECIRTLVSGEVWGWQTKYFLSPPTNGQWSEIDASVRQALDHYSSLTRYTICLPIDRADARISNRVSFMDRWDARVRKWSEWASDRGRTVRFVYWGEHEVLDALARREHAGRARFWFSREILDHLWLETHLERAMADAGPRYSRTLNVQLDISEVFDGLERNNRFSERLLEFWTAVWKAFCSVDSAVLRAAKLASIETLGSEIGALRTLVLSVHAAAPIDPFPSKGLITALERVSSATRDCELDIERLADAAGKKTLQTSATPVNPGQVTQEPTFRSENYHLHVLASRARDLREFLNGEAARAARVGALLLEGEAGMGKTHLLCDVARRAVANGYVAVVLLGEKFTREEPWSQSARQLGLPDQGADEVLGTISAAAEARGQSALLLIDAVNEGDGRSLWPRYLAGVLAAVQRYPWVAIGVSVRRSYISVVIPQDLHEDRLVRVEHTGFRHAELRATRAFFDFYGIERPSVPVLTPEFSNPLFLSLFCKGLSNASLRRIPEGLEGISAVFGFFVSSIDQKLSREDQFGFDPQACLVDRAISALARTMADERTRWLPRDRTQAIVNALLPRDRYEQTLFRGLLVEGVLSEEIFFTHEGQPVHGVRFTYERFADHRIAQYLLEQHLDRTDPSEAFKPGAPLADLVNDLVSAWQNRGIIEALSIQLPELIGRELVEVLPQTVSHGHVRHAFLESLIWRRAESIRDVARELVVESIACGPAISGKALDVLLTVASNPAHSLNAEFLHARLTEDSLPERDRWWSTYLFRSYRGRGPVDRMVDWALTAGIEPHYSDDSVELCSVALAWFLTTSHRFVRDRATKGLVALLENRIGILKRLLERFQTVNDPYVCERLYAVAYGCALRTADHESIDALAREIFRQIFQSGSPPPHLLLRDYARGVIEVAADRGQLSDLDLGLIRPPYRTAPPEEPPTEEELRSRYHPDTDPTYWDLWGSVMGGGDFERYILGTNSHSFEFTRRPLLHPWEAPPHVRYDRFVETIPKRAQRAWRILQTIRIAANDVRERRPADWLKEWLAQLPDGTDAGLVLELEEAAWEERFLSQIGKKRRVEYETQWKSFDPVAPDADLWDLGSAQRWIFSRVLELGWTPDRFGEFDSYVDEEQRSAQKPERIGKKYQWLAYHEYLARVADNFEFRPESFVEDEQRYEGPWQGHWRDIDPSMLSGTVPRKRDPIRREDWNSFTYDAWRFDLDDETWLALETDFPTPTEFLRWTDPRDSARWLALSGGIAWEKLLQPDSGPRSGPRRQVDMRVRAYIVRYEDLVRVRKWADGRDLWKFGIPDGVSTSHVFMGEYSWAPAYVSQYGKKESDVAHDRSGSPVHLVPASDTYHWSGGDYDCSIDESLNILVPTARLLPRRQGIWPCEPSRAMFMNPGVTGGPHVLLARDPEWQERLARRRRTLIWLMTGSKIVWSNERPAVTRISGVIWPTTPGFDSSLTFVRK